MNIHTIQVTAGCTFNHPHEQYSEVTMTATLEAGEDATKAAQELYQLTERQSEMRGLQHELERAQKRLEAIRSENPTLQLGV